MTGILKCQHTVFPEVRSGEISIPFRLTWAGEWPSEICMISVCNVMLDHRSSVTVTFPLGCTSWNALVSWSWNVLACTVLDKLTYLKVNSDSGDGLTPSSNKPLPEPKLTQIYAGILRHRVTDGLINTYRVCKIYMGLRCTKDSSYGCSRYQQNKKIHCENIAS